MHNYVQEYQLLMREGTYKPDFDHIINQLEFGIVDQKTSKKIKRDFSLKTLQKLNGMSYTNLMQELGFPHGIHHQISIVPSKFEYGPKEVYELFQYTSDSYKIAMGSMRVTFEFDVENFYMHYKIKSPNYSHILIQILSIVGGFYTVVMILKSFLEDGILNVAFKRRIGKFD